MTGPGAPGLRPVPIALLTGFLGAGKTTLLNALLRRPEMAGTAVLVNEFGEVGIDHLLVEGVAGDMLVLNTGCVCCAARGDLIDGLKSLLERRCSGQLAFDRVVLETTGIADPGPILNSVLLDPDLRWQGRIGSVVTVIDAATDGAVLRSHPEAVRQVALADALVLSKTDLLPGIPGQANPSLESRLRLINPAAPILRAQDLKAVLAALLDPAPTLANGLRREASDHRGAEPAHAASVRATCLRAGVVQSARFQAFLEILGDRDGAHLLRLKGLVATSDDPTRPLVVDVVQHMLHPSRRLPAWPSDDRGTRIVVITEDMEPESVRDLWNAFFGPPSIDRPDAAALLRPAGAGMGLFS